MKARRMFALLLAVVLCFGGCVRSDTPPTTAPTTQSTTQPTTEPTTVPATEPSVPTTEPTVLKPNPGLTYGETLESYQLRMPGYEESYMRKFHNQYGPCARVRSTAELNAIMECLDRDGDTATALEEYDEAFFSRQDLILIPVSSNTGSARYTVEVHHVEDGTMTLAVRAKPFDPNQSVTDDMADWLMLVPLDRAMYGEMTIQVESSNSLPGNSEYEVLEK